MIVLFENEENKKSKILKKKKFIILYLQEKINQL